jgi:calcineurin-like phosphoesterase family protein
MSKNIWVVSDTHFNHANILTFKDSDGNPTRRFNDVEEMNEAMIENWNSVVKPGDKVYHLGDVLFGHNKQEWMNNNWPRLNGSKRLVIGNHDNVRFLTVGGFFKKVMLWRQFNDWGLLLTHVPVHPSTLNEDHRFGKKPITNVHGHIHQNKSPEGPYKCVCVEQTNYTPVNIEELK